MDIVYALLAVAGFAGLVYGFVRLCMRLDRAFVLRSLLAMALFAGVGAIGFWIMWSLAAPPAPPARALAAALFMLFWIAFAGLWLTRLAPRLREPPAWMARPGAIDIALGIAVLLAGGYLAMT